MTEDNIYLYFLKNGVSTVKGYPVTYFALLICLYDLEQEENFEECAKIVSAIETYRPDLPYDYKDKWVREKWNIMKNRPFFLERLYDRVDLIYNTLHATN